MQENAQAADNEQAQRGAAQDLGAKVDSTSYDLDLDLLQPQAKHVRLNGKVYEVFPPKVKDIANLARLAGQLRDTTGENVEAKVGEMIDIFQNLMPGLKDDGVDLSMEQLMALFGFVNNMVSPAENSALKTMGIEPTQEKKAPVA